MSNLVTKDHYGIPEYLSGKLAVSEQNVFLATIVSDENKRIGELSDVALVFQAGKIWKKATLRLGLREKDPEELTPIQKELANDLRKFGGLTVNEVFLALERGLDGEYVKKEGDEVRHFAPAFFVNWVKAYIETTKRPVMQKIAQIAHQEVKGALPPSEYESMVFKYHLLVKACIDTFESGEPYQDYGGVLYNFLLILELIVALEENGPEMKEAALWILNNARDRNDKRKIKQANELLEKVLAGEEDESAMAVATRRAVARKIKDLCADGEEEIIEFLEVAKEKLGAYFTENGLWPPKE